MNILKLLSKYVNTELTLSVRKTALDFKCLTGQKYSIFEISAREILYSGGSASFEKLEKPVWRL